MDTTESETEAKNKYKLKNITRFDCKSSQFSGWRFSIMRGGYNFVKYFSDKQYGGRNRSLAAAMEKRAEVYGIIHTCMKNSPVSGAVKRRNQARDILQAIVIREAGKRTKN